MNTQRAFGFGVAVLLVNLLTLGCGGDPTPASVSGKPSSSPKSDNTAGAELRSTDRAAVRTPVNEPAPVVTVETNLGTFEITLDAENAPLTVDNFLYNYVERGSYDNTIMHYSNPDYVIGGGFLADLTEIVPRAAVRNESDNGLANTKGTVAMSRSADYPHSATSHFFVNLGENSFFDYKQDAEDDEKWGYAVFGKVTSGMEVLERIAERPTHDTETLVSTPIEPIIIKSIRRR
ncbi:MAG: peptidylprolyl isomerase [Pirellulaceae bacterium]